MEVRWKSPGEWPIFGLEVEYTELYLILSGCDCSTIMDSDVLAWSPNPKGVYTMSFGYHELLS